MVKEGVDVPEGIGQDENPDGNEKDSTDECNPPHITFDLIKGGQKRIEGQGGQKKGNAKS